MISFSFNADTGCISVDSSFEKELNLTSDEEGVFGIIFSYLPCDLLDHVFIERRSKDYVSMFCGANDFLRLKFSSKSKWISLRLPRDLAAANTENPLFSAQSNKKQLHWRASLNSLEDLSLFRNFIVASCVYISE